MRQTTIRHSEAAMHQKAQREKLIEKEDYIGAFRAKPCLTPSEIKEKLIAIQAKHPKTLEDGSLLWEF